jgi:hypothetical protein
MKDLKEQDYEAYVTVIDGKTVLVDPVAYAFMQAVNKANCENTYLAQIERLQHFKNRISEKGLDPKTVVINLINVDAPYGGEIAEALMPGYDWQQHRDKGEIPFARGLAMREGMIEIIALIDKEVAEKIRNMEEVPVIVVDHSVVEIFPI